MEYETFFRCFQYFNYSQKRYSYSAAWEFSILHILLLSYYSVFKVHTAPAETEPYPFDSIRFPALLLLLILTLFFLCQANFSYIIPHLFFPVINPLFRISYNSKSNFQSFADSSSCLFPGFSNGSSPVYGHLFLMAVPLAGHHQNNKYTWYIYFV